MRALHPDAMGCGDPDDIAAVNDAWQVLGHADRRRAYDLRSGRLPTCTSDAPLDIDRGDVWGSDALVFEGSGRGGATWGWNLSRLIKIAIVLALAGATLFVLVAMIEGH